MLISISQLKDHSISVYQAIYTTSIVAKYLDTDTVKKSTQFNNTTIPYYMIFTQDYVSTSDEQVEKLSREFNIHYISCIGFLVYLLYTRVDLSFTVRKLAKLLSNPGKVHFEGLVHFFRYIRNNKTLVMKYYDDTKDIPLSDMLRQASINTDNQLMIFYDSIWKDGLDTDRIVGAYVIFYQGGIN